MRPAPMKPSEVASHGCTWQSIAVSGMGRPFLSPGVRQADTRVVAWRTRPAVSRAQHPDFVEAIERGLKVLRAFNRRAPSLSLSEVARATGLPRPTARRILITLELLGYVRTCD